MEFWVRFPAAPLIFAIVLGKLEAFCLFAMARFRIKRRPSYCTPGRAVFDVEERCLFWWEYRGMYLSLEGAEQEVEELKTMQSVKTKIMKEYD
jgi:hypothetical protein